MARSLQHYVVETYKHKWDMPDLTLRELLRVLYVDQGKPMYIIAKELGTSPDTICKWIHKEGVPARKMVWI